MCRAFPFFLCSSLSFFVLSRPLPPPPGQHEIGVCLCCASERVKCTLTLGIRSVFAMRRACECVCKRESGWMCLGAHAGRPLMDFRFFVRTASVVAVQDPSLPWPMLSLCRWAHVSQFMHVARRTARPMYGAHVVTHTHKMHRTIHNIAVYSICASVHIDGHFVCIFSFICFHCETFLCTCDATQTSTSSLTHTHTHDARAACIWNVDGAIFIWVKGTENAWQNVISRSARCGNGARTKAKS